MQHEVVRNSHSRNHSGIGKSNTGNTLWPRTPGLQRKCHLAGAKHKNKLMDSRHCQKIAIFTEKTTGCVASLTLTFTSPACWRRWPQEKAKRTVQLVLCTLAQLPWFPHPGKELIGHASRLCIVHSSAQRTARHLACCLLLACLHTSVSLLKHLGFHCSDYL